jgi:hypothetical protein
LFKLTNENCSPIGRKTDKLTKTLTLKGHLSITPISNVLAIFVHTLKADFQSSHEAPRSSLRVHAWALSSNHNAELLILIRCKHSQRAARSFVRGLEIRFNVGRIFVYFSPNIKFYILQPDFSHLNRYFWFYVVSKHYLSEILCKLPILPMNFNILQQQKYFTIVKTFEFWKHYT